MLIPAAGVPQTQMTAADAQLQLPNLTRLHAGSMYAEGWAAATVAGADSLEHRWREMQESGQQLQGLLQLTEQLSLQHRLPQQRQAQQALLLASVLPGLVELHAAIHVPNTLRHLAEALRGHPALEVLHVGNHAVGLLVGSWQGGKLISSLPALRELCLKSPFEACGQQEQVLQLLADVADCQSLQVLAMVRPVQLSLQRLLSALHGGGCRRLCGSLQSLALNRWVRLAGTSLCLRPELACREHGGTYQPHAGSCTLTVTAFWPRRSSPEQQPEPEGGWQLGLQHCAHLTQLQLDVTGCEAGGELLVDVANSCSQLQELRLSQGGQPEPRQGDAGCSSGGAAGSSSRSAYSGFMPADLHALAAGALAGSLRRLVVHSSRARPVVGAEVGLLARRLGQLQELEVEPIMRLNTGLASSRGLLPRDVDGLVAHVLQEGGLRVLQGSATWHARHQAAAGGEEPGWAAVWKGAVAAGERCVLCDLVCLGSEPAPDVLARTLLPQADR